MPLIDLWERNADIVLKYNIKQIVSAAGDGVLVDDSECARELRHYLRNISAEKLFEHVEYCLSNSFDRSGYVLQDIVNELGRRLDYEVADGLYQGRSNRIGYDGIWRSPDGHAIVLEIKTSDAYRINLDSVASYRTKLMESGQLTAKSSILLVVGRSDTGDLEAQIRGSRHAWDIRIISIDALTKLVALKIRSDEEETVEKIRSLIIPFEYTRLDNIIDVVFSTTQDVEAGSQESVAAPDAETDSLLARQQEHTPRDILEATRQAALQALGNQERAKFIAHNRAQYWSANRALRAVCPVSKLYQTGYFWYALHSHQAKFLEGGEKGFLLLCCIDHPFAYALPRETISALLPFLNVTERSDRMYWHIHLAPSESGEYMLLVPKKGTRVPIPRLRVENPIGA